MSTQRFTPEFKEEAVRQVVERGYGVPDVASRLGVSAHGLYKWVKAVSPDRSEQQSQELVEAKSEVLRLRSQPRCVEEEARRAPSAQAHSEQWFSFLSWNPAGAAGLAQNQHTPI